MKGNETTLLNIMDELSRIDDEPQPGSTNKKEN